MPTWLIWVIVIVVVIAVVAALVSMTGKRRRDRGHEQAEELRQEASARAAGLAESERHTEELRAKADLARAEAQRADELAENAEQAHRIEQAGYEDKVREADRLDPEVDDTAGEYQPDVWSDERSESRPDSPATGTDEAPGSGPRHAAPEQRPTQT